MKSKTETSNATIQRPERLSLSASRSVLFEKFRENIRMLRGKSGLSAVELADAAGIKSGTHLYALEYGKMNPTIEELVCLSNYFGVQIDDLLNKTAQIVFE